ncbi:hypothetical protein FB451DRAFT_1378003 [Mycena latifolia]|nr:hypothetical protein FB451DRAFT_1378003 [Mycena latifolia]
MNLGRDAVEAQAKNTINMGKNDLDKRAKSVPAFCEPEYPERKNRRQGGRFVRAMTRLRFECRVDGGAHGFRGFSLATLRTKPAAHALAKPPSRAGMTAGALAAGMPPYAPRGGSAHGDGSTRAAGRVIGGGLDAFVPGAAAGARGARAGRRDTPADDTVSRAFANVHDVSPARPRAHVPTDTPPRVVHVQ